MDFQTQPGKPRTFVDEARTAGHRAGFWAGFRAGIVLALFILAAFMAWSRV